MHTRSTDYRRTRQPMPETLEDLTMLSIRPTRFGAIAACAALALIPVSCSKASVKAVDDATTTTAADGSSTTTTAKPPKDADEMRTAMVETLDAASGGTFPKEQASCWADELLDEVGFDNLSAIKFTGFTMGQSGIELSKLSKDDLAAYFSTFDDCVDLYEVLVASINTAPGTDTKPITDCLKSIDNETTAHAFARWLAEGSEKDPSTATLNQQLSACFNPVTEDSATAGATPNAPADLSPTAPTTPTTAAADAAAPSTAAPTTAAG